MSMEAREESIAWQMGSVKSTISWNMRAMWSAKPSLKCRASGTFEKPQKFLNSLQMWRRRIRRDGEDFLKDEGGKETGKRIIPFASEALVKGRGIIEEYPDSQKRYLLRISDDI